MLHRSRSNQMEPAQTDRFDGGRFKCLVPGDPRAALSRVRSEASLAHGTRQKASNRYSQGSFQRPYHRSPRAIGLGDDSFVRNIDPFSVDPDAVVTVLRFPVGIGNDDAVRARAAQAFAALQPIEPRFQR